MHPRTSALDAASTPGVLATGVDEQTADHYRELGVWTGDTHTAMLRRSAAEHPDRPAVADDYRRLTYRELIDGAGDAAAWLAGAGVRRGDGVIVQMTNCVAYVELIFGIWRLGAIPVFSLPAHGARDIVHFHHTAPAYFHVSPARPPRHLRKVQGDLAQQAPELTQLRVDVQAEHPWPHPDVAVPAEADVRPSELAFLQLSGGTTGVPKLIPKTHDDYLYSVRQSLTHCDLEADSRVAVSLPAAHNFTMSSPGILGALMVGACVIFIADPSPSTLLKAIQQHGVTHLAMVPPLLLRLLNHPARDRYNLASLATVWVGGAKLSAAVSERVAPELGCRLQQVFGMAEGLVNYTALDDPVRVIVNTQGHPMSPHDEIRIVDEDDRPVPAGQVGELTTRGPYTIRRYHRNPTVNARSFTADGFYRTGDLVTQDEHGYLTVVGRIKDQINRGGEKIAPEAVENALLAHPAIHDVSVIGVPDETWGEKSCAYVIPRHTDEGAALTEKDVRIFARSAGLAAFAVPDYIRLVEEFPLTGVGKVSKSEQRK
ncbi:(2,3-dihydroxybenzoyl)adenylate synthase [Corynebacterium frankenforstense]